MAEEKEKLNKKSKSSFWEVAFISGLILALLGVIALLYWGSLRYRAELNHVKAVNALNNQKIDKAYQHERNAVQLASFEDRYHRGLSQIYLARINKLMNKDLGKNSQKTLQPLTSSAVGQAQRATQMSSHNLANWANQAFIYQTLAGYAIQGASEKAIESYKKAIELSPSDPELYKNLAQAYMTKASIAARGKDEESKNKNLEKANEKLKKALELKSDYWPAVFQQAIVYNKQGELDQSIKKVKQAGEISNRNASFQLGVLRWRQGDLEKAQTQFEKAVKINSNFANARYFLGLIYDKQGQKQKAIEQFEKIASLGEQNKKQVDKILQRLKAGQPALGKEVQFPTQSEDVPDLKGATSTSATSTPQNQ